MSCDPEEGADEEERSRVRQIRAEQEATEVAREADNEPAAGRDCEGATCWAYDIPAQRSSPRR